MLFLILAYALFALLVIRGLARLPLRRERDNLTVSVIIAAHNEADRIGPLLACLRQLDYPPDQQVHEESKRGVPHNSELVGRDNPSVKWAPLPHTPTAFRRSSVRE